MRVSIGALAFSNNTHTLTAGFRFGYILSLMAAVNYIFNLPNTNEINDGRVKRSEVDISED